MAKAKEEKPRGILNPGKGKEKFKLERFVPSEDIAFFVEHFWIVEWDLRGLEPYSSETLPHPSIHIVFEKELSNIVGIMKQKFSRILEDKGIVFGIKFKPGAFYPFVKKPVSSFTNRTTAVANIFGDAGRQIENIIYDNGNYTEITGMAEKFLSERLPERDENVSLINKIVYSIINNMAIVKVDDLVKLFEVNKRTLQRLFNTYVGINPKWVIKRYRLHEAAEQLATNVDVDPAKLAVDLGYYDQAHFIKDFKSIVGKSPMIYAKQNLQG